MHIVVTGANGLLATELKKLLKFTPLTREDCDIRNEFEVAQVLDKLKPDLVVHLAAITDVVMADRGKPTAWATNVSGTLNVARHSRAIMYWSTEYVFDGTRGDYNELDNPNPINYYGLTKLAGELCARDCPGKSVVVRTAFKPRPYKHPQVPMDCYSTGGYVDDMAKEFALAIENFGKLPHTLNIGLQKKSLEALALETREIQLVDLASFPVKIPRDASLDCGVWNRLKKRL